MGHEQVSHATKLYESTLVLELWDRFLNIYVFCLLIYIFEYSYHETAKPVLKIEATQGP
jgi:hypothetical protein